jgi:Protein of unknown function (DUF1501).
MDSNRRQVIHSLMAGSALFPAMVADLLGETADPLAPKAPHFEPNAKRVIFLFMTGGVSHVDSFDPKTALTKAAADGKMGGKDVPFMASPWGRSATGRAASRSAIFSRRWADCR